jgi:PiT family inorganic phosphate transporter
LPVAVVAVNWSKVGSIVMSWVVSPLMAGVISYALFQSLRWLILDAANPLRQAKRWVPFYIFLVGFIVALVTLLKGLSHVGLTLTATQSILAAAAFAALTAVIGGAAASRVRADADADAEFHFSSVEKVFTVLMIVTACAMAFAHGSNDVANAIGPVAAVIAIAQTGGSVAQQSATPIWILLIGAAGIVAGLSMYGHKVMATIGTKITLLTPSHGFAATLAAAGTVVVASGTGLPISTTHTLVGAVLGVGMARGIGAIDLRVVRTIIVSWVVTLPAGAILATVFFYILKFIFS